ncbi:9296_t:CDS:2 [Funneliformis mosseae]|uniref:9296_t:CDS:1 n=1 Tax=Funneliformis mosseae TaxID=27381 RepID=A0A9N8W8Z3_FUNMO|nr:9296_t:CDS:2 [Funneliformis mosseae]
MPFILSQFLAAGETRLKHEFTGGLVYKRDTPNRIHKTLNERNEKIVILTQQRAAFDDIETVYSINSTSASVLSSQSFRTSINSVVSCGTIDADLSLPSRPSTAYHRRWMFTSLALNNDESHQICTFNPVTREHSIYPSSYHPHERYCLSQDIFVEPPPPYKS